MTIKQFLKKYPFSIFTIFIISYSIVHFHFEYKFWFTADQDIFGKYSQVLLGTDPLVIAKQVYFTKAIWMYVFVILQFFGWSFKKALSWSFLMYSIILLVLFPVRVYAFLNLVLALGCVTEVEGLFKKKYR